MAVERRTNTGIIHVNVTRTPVTLLAFNMTVITLMLSLMKTRGTTAEFVDMAHLTSSTALFVGFCLTLLGLWLLLGSQDFDSDGLSRPWPFALGTITTWLALSQTVTAFMHEYLVGIKSAVETSQPGVAESSQNFLRIGALGDAGLFLVMMGGAVWVLMTYVGPLVAGLRFPVGSGRRWVFPAYYFALQLPIYWVNAKAWHLQFVQADQPTSMLSLFALQFLQPVLWFR